MNGKVQAISNTVWAMATAEVEAKAHMKERVESVDVARKIAREGSPQEVRWAEIVSKKKTRSCVGGVF